ncbi:MAG TPA: YihY/virulence factor BrkB family protein [Candidatus Sulfotelmatobacter sp.]
MGRASYGSTETASYAATQPSIDRAHPKRVTWGALNRAFRCTYRDILQHHNLQVAAALSYYFILSVFPALILLSAVVGFVPLPDLFGAILVFMARLLPQDAMKLIHSVLADVLSSHRGAWLSLGLIGTVWIVSGAFDATIEALDIAYDAPETRPIWKTRLVALELAALSGGTLLVALAVLMVGPRFGEWLATRLYLSSLFVIAWPMIHWIIAISFAVIAVEVVYFLAPNVKQRFLATLPGAVFSVTFWIAMSSLLGVYFRHFANYNRTYGTLGGFIALMTWLYWTSFVLLVGAELNAELAKESKKGEIKPKETSSSSQTQPLDRAA